MNRDRKPPIGLIGCPWVSRPQVKRSDAKTLADLALKTLETKLKYPKTCTVRDGPNWRGIVYAGRRTRRQVAKTKVDVTVIPDRNGPGGHDAATIEGTTDQVVDTIFGLIEGVSPESSSL